jgi:hypothetical protein
MAPAASASPTATATAITTSICSAVAAAPKVLPLTVIRGAIGVILSGIVVGRKILRRRGIRVGLTLFRRFRVLIFGRRGLFGVVVLLKMLNFFGSVSFLVSYVLDFGSLFRVELLVMGFLLPLRGAGQRFSGENLDRRA